MDFSIVRGIAAGISVGGVVPVALALMGSGSGPEPPSGSAGELVTLNAKERGITDLGGIEQLTQLEVLDLYGNETRDLSPLAELKRLRYLDLGANRVEDVWPLASLKRLQVLLLADNKVTELSYRDFGNYEIYAMDADGGRPENLTLHQAYDVNPAWSPDGERIAFVSDRHGEVEVRPWRNNTDIFVMDAAGSGVEQLTSDPLSRSAEHPAWSPDGSSIASNKFDGEGFSGIFVLELSSGEACPATCSPDGARIVLAREDRVEGIAYDLYVIPAEGGAGEQFTDDPGVDRDPCWAPF